MSPLLPATGLDHEGIACLIPHSGSMCLLERVLECDETHIHCQAMSHRRADNPLRTASGLLSTAAIEYAAQAMAVHGALLTRGAGRQARPGMLASARSVELHRLRLDDLEQPLDVRAERLAGDDRQLLYAFAVLHAGALVAAGRATVVLDVPSLAR